MRMIRPKLVAPQVTIAEEQDEYKTVTAALVYHPSYPYASRRVVGQVERLDMNGLVLAFRPTDEERAKIAAGSDVYVSLLTFGRPMQPIIVTVGEHETAAIYGLEVES